MFCCGERVGQMYCFMFTFMRFVTPCCLILYFTFLYVFKHIAVSLSLSNKIIAPLFILMDIEAFVC